MVVKSASQRQVATAYLRPEQMAYRRRSTNKQGERAHTDRSKASKNACGGGGARREEQKRREERRRDPFVKKGGTASTNKQPPTL